MLKISPERFECIPGAEGDCGDLETPAAANVDLACGGDCRTIPALPIPGVALGALLLGLAETSGCLRRRKG